MSTFDQRSSKNQRTSSKPWVAVLKKHRTSFDPWLGFFEPTLNHQFFASFFHENHYFEIFKNPKWEVLLILKYQKNWNQRFWDSKNFQKTKTNGSLISKLEKTQNCRFFTNLLKNCPTLVQTLQPPPFLVICPSYGLSSLPSNHVRFSGSDLYYHIILANLGLNSNCVIRSYTSGFRRWILPSPNYCSYSQLHNFPLPSSSSCVQK